MNKERRKQIEEVISKFDKIRDQLQQILDDEQTYFDCIPENLQNSERAYNSESAINNMEDVIEKTDDILELLNEIV